MIVYYSITILANIIAVFIFHKNINISALSIIPLILIALMIFQAYFFKKEKVENGFRTTYRSNLTDNEENNMLNDKEEVLKNTIRDIEAVKASVKKMAIVNDVAKDVTKKNVVASKEEPVVNSEVVTETESVEETKAPEKKSSVRKRQISNNNQMILDLYAKGKSNIEIAKELGLGIGEVRLVIDLFNSR